MAEHFLRLVSENAASCCRKPDRQPHLHPLRSNHHRSPLENLLPTSIDSNKAALAGPTAVADQASNGRVHLAC